MSIEQTLEIILSCMPLDQAHPTIQKVQTTHRLKIAEHWGILPGSRILEIGCGQGDMTAVLAYTVGDQGFVKGIDIAPPDYGRPVTVGDSAAGIMASCLGHRVDMVYNFDLLSLSEEALVALGHFDYVVLSHSSWYLDQQETLLRLLKVAKSLGRTLCYADWDMKPQQVSQLPHFLAALIQGQIESFKLESHSNIRTLFSQADLHRLLRQSGWHLKHETTCLSENLQDPHWETQSVLVSAEHELSELEGLPDKFKQLIRTELSLLNALVKETSLMPLATYIMIAE